MASLEDSVRLALSLSLLALGVSGFAGAAQAQHPCPGYVTTNALATVPRNAAIAISGRADTRNEEQLRETVVAALQRAGHPVNEQAPYLMSWRGGVSADGLGRPSGGAVADMFSGSTFRDSDDLHWMQSVPRAGRRASPGAMRLSGFVELRERESRRVVWTAVISCERAPNAEQGALFATLANAVAPLIGQTANARPF